MLKVQNLKKYFGGIKAVDNVNFDVKKNSITALIGPNGSGKTTLFNLISGIIEKDSGKIILDNKNITDYSVSKISNTGISRIFQKSRLFPNLSVKENLLIAIDNEDMKFWKNILNRNKVTKEKETKVKKMLKLVEMSDFENKKASELSYGQKRLIELIRAILNPHKILLLDEPVAGVTPRLRKEISKLLIKMKSEGDTILLIEHDMNFALNLADNVIVMDEGKIISQGKPEKIKNNRKVLEAYLGE